MIARRFQDCRVELLDPSRSDDFFRLVDANRDRLEDFFSGTVARCKTLKDTRDYCELVERRIKERLYFPYMVCDRSTGEYLGLVDIKSIEWSVPKAEIGYFIDQKCSGRGIISEALGHVIEMVVAEFGFRKLLCRVNSGNLASIRVAVKNGFELEGTIRNDYVTTSGKPVDLDYYGRVFQTIS